MDELLHDIAGSRGIDYTAFAQKIFYRLRIAAAKFCLDFLFFISAGILANAVYSDVSESFFSSVSRMIVSEPLDILPEREVCREKRSNYFGPQITLIDRKIGDMSTDFTALKQPEYNDSRLSEYCLDSKVKQGTGANLFVCALSNSLKFAGVTPG
ncbi:MAG: hypothetical protein ACPGKS_05085 [Coraliomargarita sp.]